MWFDPSGFNVVGGVAQGTYLNGRLIDPHSGGWGWTDVNVIAGPAGFDISKGRMNAFRLTDPGVVTVIDPWAIPNNFYARPYIWVAYRTDVGSYDSLGRTFGKDRIILAISAARDCVFTDSSNVALYVLSPENKWYSFPHPDPWQALPSGGYFSRQYRGCFHQGEWWAVASKDQLELWRPFNPSAPVWKLSVPGHYDFNPDIVSRPADGLLVVASGTNAGETGYTLYEMEVDKGRYRINGGWSPLHG